VYLSKKGKLNEDEALKIMFQVGEALSYIHAQGFLHRDIKPNNILVRSENLEAVLIDFGLAREFVTGKTLTHTNYVTESFAPIEQYLAKTQRGAFTDVYALSATLYNLLTGELPLPSRFRSYVVLPSPKQSNQHISDQVNEAILKGMELEPEKRCQTVQEWLDLLLPESSTEVNEQGLSLQSLEEDEDDLSSTGYSSLLYLLLHPSK
jgi:serine/threonine protein kinase